MQIDQEMTLYSQPNFDQIVMMKKDISANLYQKCVILCSTILLNVLSPVYELNSFATMLTCWVLDLPNMKGISGHLQR